MQKHGSNEARESAGTVYIKNGSYCGRWITVEGGRTNRTGQAARQTRRVVDPGPTVVAQDPYALGRTAAELLFGRLRAGQGPYRHVVLSTTLIARGSGELPAPPPARTRAP